MWLFRWSSGTDESQSFENPECHLLSQKGLTTFNLFLVADANCMNKESSRSIIHCVKIRAQQFEVSFYCILKISSFPYLCSFSWNVVQLYLLSYATWSSTYCIGRHSIFNCCSYIISTSFIHQIWIWTLLESIIHYHFDTAIILWSIWQ